MPKKFKELKNKKLSDSLTNQERNAVDDVEKYIDEQIELQWENGSVYIDHCIMTFECDPITHLPTIFLPDKRDIMKELLFSTYNDADWKILLQSDMSWRLMSTKT